MARVMSPACSRLATPWTWIRCASSRSPLAHCARARRRAAPQLVGEHAVGQLRGVVGVLTGVFLLTLQVVEVEAACCMGGGGHSHDPYGCTGYEPVEQQVGE